MTRTDLYYVVAEPQNKGTFRPIVLEYGIDLIHAEKVVRKHINDNGLRYKIGDKKYPAFIRIRRISDTLPDDYILFTKAEVAK